MASLSCNFPSYDSLRYPEVGLTIRTDVLQVGVVDDQRPPHVAIRTDALDGIEKRNSDWLQAVRAVQVSSSLALIDNQIAAAVGTGEVDVRHLNVRGDS